MSNRTSLAAAASAGAGGPAPTYVYVYVNLPGQHGEAVPQSGPWAAAPRGGAHPPEPGASEETLPTPEEDGPCRWYVVWKVPGRPEFFGVVRAAEPDAWKKLESLLPGQRYIGSGARLRRVDSLVEAREVYRGEARRHGRPEEPPFLRL